MRGFPWLRAALAAALLGLLLGSAAVTQAPVSAQGDSGGAAASEVVVSVSATDVSALAGDTFTFTSEITNTGSEPTPPLVAHLNIVSLDQSVYVDPEDWSPQRTVGIAPIASGASTTQSWTVNPILKGDVAVYVVVLPASPSLATTSPPIASPAIRVRVDEQRSLNPGGVLPIVIAVPGVLAGAFVILRVNHGRGHRQEPPRESTRLTR